MNKTLLLTKVLLRNGSGMKSKGKNGKKTNVKNILLLLLVAIAFIPVISMIVAFTSFLYDSMAGANMEGAILGLALAVVSVAVFLFGIFYVINVFYFSQDVEHLLPLPLKPSQILGAKFGVTLLYEYLTELFLLLPILITFGIKSGAGPLYYVYGLIIFLTLPVLPLVIASVIAMLIMRFTGVAKNKDRFRMIGGAVAVAFGLGANMLFQRFGNGSMKPEQMQDMLLNGNNVALDLATRLFPSTKLGANALLNAASLQGLAAIIMFTAISVLVFVLFALLGELLYFKGVMGMSETTAKRRKVTSEQLDKQTAQSSALAAFTFRELKTLFRTPIFFINCVLISFLWPVIICIPLVTQASNIPNLESLTEFLSEPQIAGIAIGIAVALFLFLTSTNATASTSFSREGTNLFVLKYLPVPYRKVIIAKALAGFVLSMISIVLVLIVAILIVHIPPMLALAMLAVGIPAALFGNLTGVMIDLHFPKLHWDNEQKAVKQNMNVLISMFINIIVAGASVASTLYFKLSLTSSLLIFFILFALLDYVLYRLLTTKGEGWLDKIEV